MKEKIIIKPNSTFGLWTVIQKDETKRKDAHTYWICQCKCGNKKSVRSTSLRSGKSQSCGCDKNYLFIENQKCSPKIINISNQRFGKIIAKYPVFEEKREKLRWYCICDCGTEFLTEGESLRKGLTQSCGCTRFSKGEQKIEEILKTYNISFIREKTFENCRFPDTNFKARFDFFVNNEYLIEFDGIQHFKEKALAGWTANFAHDEFKNQWCLENNMPLIRIPYTQLNKLTINDLKLESSNFIYKK